MKTDPQSNDSDGTASQRIANEAACWVLRLDRSLSAVEQDDYSQWLAADSRHREALALQRWGWEELDRLAGLQTSLNAMPDPNLLAPPSGPWAKIRQIVSNHTSKDLQGSNARILMTLAALTLGIFVWHDATRTMEKWVIPLKDDPSEGSTNTLSALIKQRTLSDGSTVELNRGAVVETLFTATERRVRLVRGEANFIVAKNPTRPFIVSAGGVEARAVGTVFNVRLDSTAVEVLVSEGKVAVAKVGDPDKPSFSPPESHPVEAGQRAIVLRTVTETVPMVTTLSQTEIDAKMAWQPRMLDFTDEPLVEIVAEFNRRNPVQITLGEPALASLRLSATFRSDNLEGFVRLMESDFGMQARRNSETEIILGKVGER